MLHVEKSREECMCENCATENRCCSAFCQLFLGGCKTLAGSSIS